MNKIIKYSKTFKQAKFGGGLGFVGLSIASL